MSETGVPVGRAREQLAQAFSDPPALIAYLMAGYPDRQTSFDSVRAAVDAGADVIELGVPYGDPLADGPVIADAGRQARAQEGGFGLAQTISLAADLVRTPRMAPLVLMTYLNPVLTYRMDALARDAQAAGIAGTIIPDLPADSPFAVRWIQACRAHDLATVFLVAPTSTDDRLERVAANSGGFIYVVSSTGVTGERSGVPADLPALIERVRSRASETPIAVGFGIATPDQAAEVGSMADGVIVGSAIVRRQSDPAALGVFVHSVAAALHSS